MPAPRGPTRVHRPLWKGQSSMRPALFHGRPVTVLVTLAAALAAAACIPGGVATAAPAAATPQSGPVAVLSPAGWATIPWQRPDTSYWNTTPDPAGRLLVGHTGPGWAHTLLNFPVGSVPAGATVTSARLTITETWSASCTPSPVDVYAPATTLTAGNATWKSWARVNLGPVAASVAAANGAESSC